MRLAIHHLLDGGTPPGPAIDAFLRNRSFPLIEGDMATFVFHGNADAVNLRHWIYGLESSQPFSRVPGTDFWYHVHELPPGSRVEYKLEVIRGGHHEWIRDPFNPHLAQDPFGANSVAQGSGYTRPDWSRQDPESRPGRLEELWLTHTQMGLTLAEIKRIILNGFKAAFLPFHVKQAFLRRIAKDLQRFHDDGTIEVPKPESESVVGAPAGEVNA